MDIFYCYHGYCFCPRGGALPAGAIPVEGPFHPLVFLVARDPAISRGYFAIESLDALDEPENLHLLRPCSQEEQGPLANFVQKHGASVLNTAFTRAFPLLFAQSHAKIRRLTLVGLGDVGGATLMGLRLLGGEIESIGIYDPNEALCARYELELNQVLAPESPRIEIIEKHALFACDALLFTATRGVPPLGSEVKDVRMAQYAANKAMVKDYARQARDCGFNGLFAQISDPVDHLARAVFLESNRDEAGRSDYAGLLPEQIQGYGLGVMQARAAYYAKQRGIPIPRAYGPHGQGLVVANAIDDSYNEQLSCLLTQETKEANLRVRSLGFKPYIAPGLSSACISILRTLRGEWHEGAVPLGPVYFGCRSRFGEQGMVYERNMLPEALFARLAQSYRELEGFVY